MPLATALPETSPPADPVGHVGLRMTFTDGELICDELCRRGEVRVRGSWESDWSEPILASKARPLIALMGGTVAVERREVRQAVAS